MRQIRRFTFQWWTRSICVGLVSLSLTGSASAFYFRGWPGDGVPRDQNFVTPTDRFTDTEPGRRSDRDHDHEDPTTPQSPGVPEPGTVVLGGIGLGLVGLMWRRRR